MRPLQKRKNTVFTAAISVLMVIFVFAQVAEAATYTFTQNNWTGGQSASTLVSPAASTTYYSAASNVVAGSSVSVTTSSLSITQTSNTDFASGTLSQTVVNGSGAGASVELTQGTTTPYRADYVTGTTPKGVAFDPVTNSIWEVNSGTNTVSKFNVLTGASTSYVVGTSLWGITFDPSTNSMWATGGSGVNSRVYKINITSGTSTTYTIGSTPQGIAFDAVTNSLWVANNAAAAVMKVNPLTGATTSYAVGLQPYDATFDTYTNSIWVSNNASGTVSKINPSTGTSTPYVLGATPKGITFDAYTNSVWTVNASPNSVSKINVLTGTSTQYALSASAQSIAFDPVTDSVWVTATASNLIFKVNVTSGAALTYVAGSGAWGVAFDSLTNSVWVTNSTGPSISKVAVTLNPHTEYAMGTQPWGVVAETSTNSVWVTNVSANAVVKIDPLTGASTSYGVGNGPQGLAFDANANAIWTANNLGASISKVNATSGAATTYAAGSNPYDITFDAYTNSVWVSSNGSNFISKIKDTISNPAYKVGSLPQNAVFDSYTNSIWVVNSGSNTVAKVDPATGASTSYSVGTQPWSAAFDSSTNSLWVSNHGNNSLSKVNVTTGTTTNYSTGIAAPEGIAFDPITNSVWVANNSSGTISKVNVATGAATIYALGGPSSQPYDVAFDSYNNFIWVTAVGLNRIYQFNVTSGTSTYASLGYSPKGITYDPSTKSIWIANNGVGSITKLNVITATSTTYTLSGSQPWAIAFDASANALWVSESGSGMVAKVNPATGQVIGYFYANLTPQGLVAETSTNSLWVVNNGSNDVSKIGLSATPDRVDYTITGSGPRGIVFDPYTNSVWVANSNLNSVSKFNVSSGTSTSYSVNSPYGLAFDPSTNSVWVANTGYYTVTRLNAVSGTSTAYSTNLYGFDVAYDPYARGVWVSPGTNGSLAAKVDVASGMVSYYVAASYPLGMAYDSVTQSMWIANNGSASVSKIPLLSYASPGTYTSVALNVPNIGLGTISWTSSQGQTITMQARSGTSSAMTNAPAWGSCSNIATGGLITSGGCATNGDPYVQFRATLSSSDPSVTPSLDDVTVSYASYNASGNLVSLPYDTSDATNQVAELDWTQSASTPSDTGVTISLRAANSSEGLSSAPWNSFTTSTAGCTFSGATTTCPSAVLPPALKSNAQFWQYQIAETADASNTPSVSNVVVKYVVNAPPHFQSPVPVAVLAGDPSTAGQVQFQFSVKDADADTDGSMNGHATSTVTPSYQYSLDNGNSWGPMTSFATLNATADIAVTTSSFSPTSTIIWNAAADVGARYSTTTLIRVTVDDHQLANNTAATTTAAFTLDTKPPAVNALSVDAGGQAANFNFSDDSNLLYRISGSPFTTSTPTSSLPFFSVGANATSATGYALPLASTSSPVAYVELQDAYGNDSYATHAGLAPLSGFSVKDVSNKGIGLYQVYLSWATSTLPDFKQYDIYRSAGGAFAPIATISSAGTNVYTDTGLSSSTAYYYKVRVENTNGDISAFTAQLFVTPTGNGGGPAISSVAANPGDTSAIITWNTNVMPQSSYAYWSLSPTMAQPISIAATVASSGPPYANTATLADLTPSSTYYFYVQSTDAVGNTTIDKNDGAYYSFQTTNSEPPVISNVQVTPTQNSANIRWQTSKLSNSAVWYGTAPGGETTSVSSTVSLTMTPEVVLNNLQASTTYYYYALSADSGGHVATTSESSFTTSQLGPVITGVGATGVSDFGATVTWDTNVDADSHVYYSTSTDPGSFTLSAGTNAFVGGDSPFAHSVSIAGLTPSITYYFYVQSVDAFNNYATDKNEGRYYSFVTTNAATPIISNIQVPLLTGDTAAVSWTTDKSTDALVAYGTSTGMYPLSVSTSTHGIAHELFLTGLSASTTYYFIAQSVDLAGHVASSSEISFTTQAPVFTNVTTTYVGDTSVIVSWQTSIDSNSFVHYFTPGSGVGAAAGTGTTTFVGGVEPFTHTVLVDGLTPGATYLYYLESDDVNNAVHLDDNYKNYYTFTTTDHQPPAITHMVVPVTGETAAIITWTTDKLSTSQIDLGTAPGTYVTSTPFDATLTTTHAVPITGLTQSTKYYYRVHSQSALGVEAVSSESSFTTISPQTNYAVGGGGGGGAVIDTTPPQVTNVSSSTTPFDGRIDFTTSENAVGIVEYGPTIDYGFAASDSSSSLTHVVTAKGLVMGTTYHFRIKAIDRSGNIGTSTAATFTTQYLTEASPSTTFANAYQFQQEIENGIQSILPSLVPPFLETPQAVNVTETGATITWKTNINSYSVVFYAADNAYDATKQNPYTDQSSDVNTKTMAHSLTLSGLQANTKYHFMAESFSIPGVFGKSADMTFTTKASQVTAQVSALKPTSFKVSWATNIPTNSIVEYKDTKTGITQTITDDGQVTVHSVVVGNLVPARTYAVTASGYTADGNLVSAANVLTVRTTKDTVPPKILNIKIQTIIDPQNPTVAQAVVSWVTDKPANSAVFYDPGVVSPGKELSHNVEDLTSFTSAHVLIVPSLIPGGVYSIQISSMDQASNTAMFAPQTIVVSQQSQSILNVILNNFQNTFQFLQKLQGQ